MVQEGRNGALGCCTRQGRRAVGRMRIGRTRRRERRLREGRCPEGSEDPFELTFGLWQATWCVCEYVNVVNAQLCCMCGVFVCVIIVIGRMQRHTRSARNSHMVNGMVIIY
jgi:hypothetical protein